MARDFLSGRAGRVIVVDHAELEPSGAILFARLAAELAPRGGVVLLGHGLGGSSGHGGTELASDSAARPIRSIELCPLGLVELGRDSRNRHWLRGGYPEAFMALDDKSAFSWLGSYAGNAAGAILAAAGMAWQPSRVRSLLFALAESQGQVLNGSSLASRLGISRPCLSRCLDALVEAGMLRLLPSSVPGKAPVLYFRDTGLLHAILGLESRTELESGPAAEASWEGYAIEQSLSLLPEGFEASRYESRDGAKLELVIGRRGTKNGNEGRPLLGASIAWSRRGRGSSVPRAALYAARRLALERSCLVLPDADEARLADGFRVMSLERFLGLVADLA
jgi:predicted AAA+ superfamily ATPase